MSRVRTLTATFVAVLTAGALSACSSGATDIESTVRALASPSASATSSSSSSSSTTTTCSDAQRSYSPLASVPSASDLPAGTWERTIRDRGRLVVGVSADTLLFGYRNPLSGSLEGFDIDQVKAVATAILGSSPKIEYRVITAAQRIPLLQKSVADGGVDLVARTMTVTCDRWKQASFSSVYFMAHQRLLVARGAKVTSLAQLKGQKVCAPAGSTSAQTVEDADGVTPVEVATHTDCLVLFQQGTVAAIIGDDAVLAGFAAQDPYAQVVGPALTDEPYALALPADAVAGVRFVNAVLEREKKDGAWSASYGRWLRSDLGTTSGPPAAQYGRSS